MNTGKQLVVENYLEGRVFKKVYIQAYDLYSRVHTTKPAQARPRPGLGSAQVNIVSTRQIANVNTNLGRSQDSTQVIARNVRNKDDYLLVRK